jgi:glycerophosphoryl diester phosphodiesterase
MKNRFFFAALICLTCFQACEQPPKRTGENPAVTQSDSGKLNDTYKLPAGFDLQGHRGARGLAPENTLPAFIAGINNKVNTLELDVVISKDRQIIVSHEPWFNSKFTTTPNGDILLPTDESGTNILEMDLNTIKTFDVGRRRNPDFPFQKTQAAVKPTLREVVETTDAWCKENNLNPPHFNIEIKSSEENDNYLTPVPETYVRLVVREIRKLGIDKRSTLQSFDLRSLREARRQAPEIPLSLLTDKADQIDNLLQQLGFHPEIFSPDYTTLNSQIIMKAHKLNMKVIPYTVNDSLDMRKTIESGVDGMITDYPDRAQKILDIYRKR